MGMGMGMWIAAAPRSLIVARGRALGTLHTWEGCGGEASSAASDRVSSHNLEWDPGSFSCPLRPLLSLGVIFCTTTTTTSPPSSLQPASPPEIGARCHLLLPSVTLLGMAALARRNLGPPFSLPAWQPEAFSAAQQTSSVLPSPPHPVRPQPWCPLKHRISQGRKGSFSSHPLCRG